MVCLCCNKKISEGVFEFSIKKYNFPLCNEHQELSDFLLKKTTRETLLIYFSLINRGIDVELEKEIGNNFRVDLAIPSARINIEIDGEQHNLVSNQALTDLKRTEYSLRYDYYTLRIPNSLVRDFYKLDDTIDILVEIIKNRECRLNF